MRIQVLLAAFCALGAISAAAVNEANGLEMRDNHHSTSKTTAKKTTKTTAKKTTKTTLKTSAKTTKKTTTSCTSSKKTSKTTTASPTTKKATTSATTTKGAMTTPVTTTPIVTTPSTTLVTTTSLALPVCVNTGEPCTAAAANLCCSGFCSREFSTCCGMGGAACNFNGPPGQCCGAFVCGQTNVCVED